MTTPNDERARLRALAEKAENDELDHWQRVYALWELRTSITSDVVLRLLDDVEQAEEAAALHYEARVDLQKECDTERARAERAEAALKPIAGWWKIWNAGGPTPDEWIVREWMQKADAALAEPAPGAQDAERAVNAEGPPGSYGCKCTSRNALECARQAYYAGVEARERCGCLCHQWTDSGPWRCLTGDGR